MSTGVEGEPSQLLTACGAQRGRPSQSLSWDMGSRLKVGLRLPCKGESTTAGGPVCPSPLCPAISGNSSAPSFISRMASSGWSEDGVHEILQCAWSITGRKSSKRQQGRDQGRMAGDLWVPGSESV